MAFKRTFANHIFDIYGQLLSVPKQGHRCLMYHGVNSSSDPFSVSKNDFYQHMQIIEDQSLTVTPFGESKSSQFSLSLTFDDGFADNLTVVAPLLASRNWPFSVFVTPKFITENSSDYLSRQQLQELASIPCATIGAHGFSHVKLAEVPLEIAKSEMSESKKFIEDIIGKKVETMSFPNGSCNADVVRTAKDLGYRKMGTSQMSLNCNNSDLISRIVIMGRETAPMVLGKIKGSWDWHSKLRSQYEY